jgi:hypothetical protein
MKTTLQMLIAVFIFVTAIQLQAQMPAGGFAGNWKANFEKSKFPGPPPKVDECTVDADGTVTVNEVNPEGKSLSWHYTPVPGKAVSLQQSLTGGVLRENAQVLRFDQDDNRSRQSKGDHGVTGSGIVKSTAGVCEDNILLAVLAEESHGDGIGSGLKLG